MKATGTDMVKVPYKGAGQVMPDLIAGRVQVNFSPVSALALNTRRRPGADAGGAVAAAQPYGARRSDARRSGLQWRVGVQRPAVVAPAKTPNEIVERLHGTIASALQDPDVRARLGAQAVQAESSTPQALAALIEEDFRNWARFIRENGLVPE